jgi:hypothetical protein
MSEAEEQRRVDTSGEMDDARRWLKRSASRDRERERERKREADSVS